MRPDEIQVFQLELDSLPAQVALLSSDERERAARFRFEVDRHRYITCRSVLRKILADELSRAPQDISFTYNAHGKPSLDKCHALFFNVAHSGPMALITLTRVAPLGIDIEAIRPELATTEVAVTVFTTAERAMLNGPDHVEQFFRLWTRKEAYLKAIGKGFASPNLDIPKEYQIQELPIRKGYLAALAISGATYCQVRLSWYSDTR